MISQQLLSDAAGRLYQHLLRNHWTGRALRGPDPGIRLNARIGRFIKSYSDFIRWDDSLTYAQTQKYWIMNNGLMADLNLADPERCHDIAVACGEYLLSVQRPDGYWEYPNREWQGRVATVEGNYAAMALLEAYHRTQHDPFLDAAKRWYRFAVDRIGFQKANGLMAINYFCDLGTGMVPNNSASALRVFAMLSKASGDEQYLETCRGMVAWLNQVQLESGELPYAVAGPGSSVRKDRIHFLCFQYNAFQFLNLTEYHDLTQDRAIWPVLEKLARFISQGVCESGAVCYDCRRKQPEVTYYATAVGAALSHATVLGLGDYSRLANRSYERVLTLINPDGSLRFHSRGRGGFPTDRRSYPRYLSMILHHLLLECAKRVPLGAGVS